MRPLDRVPSIKLKLGALVVAAVAGTTLALVGGIAAGFGWLLSAAIAVAAGLASIQLLARGMTSPLREMSAAARAMAKGDYSKRVTASSRDEVGELARAFNKMAADLAEVDRMRRDLVANVSHELRTPIAALQALLENLVDGIEVPDRASLETMLTQVQRLNNLVQRLLDLSQLESGAIPLHMGHFEIAPVLEQAIQEARLHAAQAGRPDLHVDVDISPQDLTAHGDAERIHQVVVNLLDNAVRHSPAGSSIAISARDEDGEIILEVADEGPGIPSQDRERIFERFYRSDASRSSGSGGAGLGLAIARWIVELHGGRIRAEANEPRGSRLVVALPE